jgi:hypothetical protein
VLKVVLYLEEHAPGKRDRKPAVVISREIVFATRDIQITMHGFKQCNLFWLAAW